MLTNRTNAITIAYNWEETARKLQFASTVAVDSTK